MNTSLKKFLTVLFATAVILAVVASAGCVSSTGFENPKWFNSDIIENTMDESKLAEETFLHKDNFYNTVNKEYVLMGSEIKKMTSMSAGSEPDPNQLIDMLNSPLFQKLMELMALPSFQKQMQDELSEPDEDMNEMIKEMMDPNTMAGMLVTMFTPMTMGQLIISDQLLRIETDPSLEGYEAEVIRAYQAVYSDMKKRNADGVAPVLPYVNEIRAVSTLEELTELIGTGGSASLKEVFVREDIGGSLNNGKITTVTLYPGIFALSNDPGLYQSMTEESAEQYEKIIASFSRFLVSCGFSEDEARATASAFKNLETAIAQVCYPKDAEQSMPSYYVKINNPVTYKALQSMNFPVAADLQIYADSGASSFSVSNPAWLEKLNSLYTEENLEGFKAMMLFSLYTDAASHLDSASRKLLSESATDTLLDKTKYQSSSIFDQDRNKYLGMAYGKYYVQHYTTQEMKQKITDLVGQIVVVYKERIKEADWLSQISKDGAIDKLDNLKIRIFEPGDWSYYSYDDVDLSHFGTLLDATIELKKHNQNLLVKNSIQEPSEDIWPVALSDDLFIIPQTVNAFYNPIDNSINILPGFTNTVYNEETESEEEMLAVVGTTIAHEISHGLDPTGSKFDKDGTYKNWWAPGDKITYATKIDAVADYFSGFEAKPGVYLNGSQYTGEVIADLGGFSIILAIASEIEDFDYQKFFTKYAATMYSPNIDQIYTDIILKDVHPPHMYRINVNVQQYDEFLTAFDITEGDMMYLPKDRRITIW